MALSYRQPRLALYCRLASPVAASSARAAVLGALWLRLVEEALAEDAYLAGATVGRVHAGRHMTSMPRARALQCITPGCCSTHFKWRTMNSLSLFPSCSHTADHMDVMERMACCCLQHFCKTSCNTVHLPLPSSTTRCGRAALVQQPRGCGWTGIAHGGLQPEAGSAGSTGGRLPSARTGECVVHTRHTRARGGMRDGGGCVCSRGLFWGGGMEGARGWGGVESERRATYKINSVPQTLSRDDAHPRARWAVIGLTATLCPFLLCDVLAWPALACSTSPPRHVAPPACTAAARE